MSVAAHWGRRIKRFMEQSASYQSSSEQTTIGHVYKHKQTDSLRSSVGRPPSALGGRINDGSSVFPPDQASRVRNTHTAICGPFFSLSSAHRAQHVTRVTGYVTRRPPFRTVCQERRLTPQSLWSLSRKTRAPTPGALDEMRYSTSARVGRSMYLVLQLRALLIINGLASK